MSKLFVERMKTLADSFRQELFFEDATSAFVVNDLAYNFCYNESTGRVLVYAVVADISGKTQEEKSSIYATLVKAQYCFHMCDGCTFGVDPDSAMVNLQMRIDLNLFDDSALATQMEGFMNTAIAWKEILDKMTFDASVLSVDNAAFKATSEEFIIRA